MSPSCCRSPANPAERATHRVYLKRMLLAEGVEGLLPDWAFFVRAVIDTSELRPTASREALFDDGTPGGHPGRAGRRSCAAGWSGSAAPTRRSWTGSSASTSSV